MAFYDIIEARPKIEREDLQNSTVTITKRVCSVTIATCGSGVLGRRGGTTKASLLLLFPCQQQQPEVCSVLAVPSVTWLQCQPVYTWVGDYYIHVC